ncbi:hypothetical protein FH972_024840 [Carpinus fangiana]|uniref:Uncharacterized protein n=1 Tax=Carpinus fangiana TaxID=176857 RepID=A0A5N6KZ89_9ROSI|nr:hypothetical protein FH972_024840 [Carpinus fangiana]
MKFSILATVPLLAFAAAYPSVIEERATDNTKVILSGIKTLETDITALDTQVKANPVNVINVQNAEQKVEKDITAIDNNVKSSSVVTAAESTQVYNEIKNNLQPKINTVLNDLVANKAKFSGVKSIVKTDLTKLNDQTGTLGKDFIAKAQGTAKTQAPALISAIQNKFKTAIAAFA